MLNLYERSSIIPGRASTRSKSPGRLLRAWEDDCRFKATILDTEGRERIDMLAALGARTLGYETTPRIALGVSSLPHRLEVQAAEQVLRHVAPWASSVRFMKTGSEATEAAYIVASEVTGRGLALRGSWAYHGWHSWLGRATDTFSLGDDLAVDYAGMEDVICAVFIEPPRWEHIDGAWLVDVRDWCAQNGILLVFDSMITGARWALGGTSELWKVSPDLECYGKGFGNGQSVAFLVGREALDEYGEKISGTFSGDATGLSALCDTLHIYTTEPVIETLWERGRQLQTGLSAVVPEEIGVCEGQPVHQRIRFLNEVHADQFKAAMDSRGVLWHPGCANVMYAHTEAQIARVIAAASYSVKELR